MSLMVGAVGSNPYASYMTFPSDPFARVGATDNTARANMATGAIQGASTPGHIDRKPDGSVREIGPDGQEKDPDAKVGRKSSPANCETCRNRRYVDGSDEGDVSFKAPGHISPQQSAAAVMAHEQEHVANAYEKEADGKHKVISANVSLKHAVCPECGTSYVAGGLTRTTVGTKKMMTPYAQAKEAMKQMSIGSKINQSA